MGGKDPNRWTSSGFWDLTLEALAEGGGNDAVMMVDCTIVRARHCAAGARGMQNQALGRARGGFSTKIPARTNAEGSFNRAFADAGGSHDGTAFIDLVAEHDADPGNAGRPGL